ncbi:MAG: SDR family NAD(P)-dependent oxidoreductase [Acidimicrobiales bacterium]
MSTPLLADQVGLLVGGATGIGRAVVERFVAEGASVGVLDVAAEPLASLTTLAGPAGAGRVETFVGDATRSETAPAAVAATTARFGGLDFLVCCAGRFDFRTPIGSLSSAELSSAFDEIYAVNVKASLLAVHAAMGELRRRRGSVVLTLSNSAFHPEGAGVLYGSSKWAGRGLVAHLARELAPEVRVNAVAPGGTTGTHLSAVDALHVSGSVEDVPSRPERLRAGNLLGVAPTAADHAGAFVFLASRSLSPHVTGAVIQSDGGRGEPLPAPSEGRQPVEGR